MATARRQPLRRPPVRFRSYALVFGVIALVLILAHAWLLSLPFYWDESGQFVPAALDIFRGFKWIPVSTLPNVHPPGLMAYLALFWSVFGYSIPATRIAMLLVAAFGALASFLLGIELGRGSMGTPAFAALGLLCISPLFFAQSMLAQLDMPAMGLSMLALLLFLQNRYRASAIACAVLALVKETGLVAPALFGCWLLAEGRCWERRGWKNGKECKQALWFLLPLPGLAIWLVALHHSTGHWLGNSAFTAYNLREPLHPARFLVALARRLYYLFIGSGHILGTIALLWALGRMPLLRDRAWRIAGAFVLAQVIAVSALGGAVLERYLLPALPVVYIAFAISLEALAMRTRRLTLAALAVCLVAANFINPPYPFPLENNLAFVGFVRLEQSAARAVEERPGIVATAFPIADGLRNPDFGYVTRARSVIEVSDFTLPEVDKLKDLAPDMVVVYSRAWDPLRLLDHPAISGFLARHYGYKPELRAGEIAGILSMQIADRWTRGGMSMQLLTRE